MDRCYLLSPAEPLQEDALYTYNPLMCQHSYLCESLLTRSRKEQQDNCKQFKSLLTSFLAISL